MRVGKINATRPTSLWVKYMKKNIKFNFEDPQRTEADWPIYFLFTLPPSLLGLSNKLPAIKLHLILSYYIVVCQILYKGKILLNLKYLLIILYMVFIILCLSVFSLTLVFVNTQKTSSLKTSLTKFLTCIVLRLMTWCTCNVLINFM